MADEDRDDAPAPGDDPVPDGGAGLRRTLELLWEPPRDVDGARADRGGLTREAIVAAAVSIADRDGLEGVSMRAVARELGAGTMSLYRHVPGKDELLALMVDAVTAGTAPELTGDWREDLRRFAESEWEFGHRHPWTLTVSRVVVGPATLASFETALAAAAQTGLPDREVVSIVVAVLNLAMGATRISAEARAATRRTGLDDERWWELQVPVLERHLDEATTPVLQRIYAGGALAASTTDPRAEFEASLELLLDGVAQRVAAAG